MSIRGQELGTRSGIARSLVILYSTYEGATKLFSTGVVPFTFPPTVDEARSSFQGWEGHSVIDRGWMAPSTVERREPGSPSFQVLLVPSALGLSTSHCHTTSPTSKCQPGTLHRGFWPLETAPPYPDTRQIGHARKRRTPGALLKEWLMQDGG